MIRDFAAQVETLVVVEELDPFWEEQIRAMGLKCYGKDVFPMTGEFTLKVVRDAALKAGLPVKRVESRSIRPARAQGSAAPARAVPRLLASRAVLFALPSQGAGGGRHWLL